MLFSLDSPPPPTGPLKQPLCLRDYILKPKMCLGSQKFSHKDWKPRLKIDYFLFAWKCDGRWSSNFYHFIIFKTITATNKKKTNLKLLQKFCSINAAKWCFQSRAGGVTLIMFKILQLMFWNVVGKSVSFHVLNKFTDCVPYPSRKYSYCCVMIVELITLIFLWISVAFLNLTNHTPTLNFSNFDTFWRKKYQFLFAVK